MNTKSGNYLFIMLMFLVGLFMSSAVSHAADDTKRGVVTGGVPHMVPDWFKESFLDIAEDVDEATEANRHVMLFFQLNDCPYCDRMLKESFEADPLKSHIQQNFDVIAVNVRGDRDIAFNEELSVSEKELAEHLKVRATPAILFLNKDNDAVVRVDGYRSPKRFQQVLNFVTEKAYVNTSLAEYLKKNLQPDVYQLRNNALFTDTSDLAGIEGPLAVVFEDGSCYDCNEFHDKLLNRDDVKQELEPFTLVRLDADSEAEIITPDGKKTSPKAWAREMEMTYRPGVLMFDGGQLVRRIDSLLYSFHFKEGFRYIGGGFYKTQEYRSYSEQRREELLAAGVTIDLAE